MAVPSCSHFKSSMTFLESPHPRIRGTITLLKRGISIATFLKCVIGHAVCFCVLIVCSSHYVQFARFHENDMRPKYVCSRLKVSQRFTRVGRVRSRKVASVVSLNALPSVTLHFYRKWTTTMEHPLQYPDARIRISKILEPTTIYPSLPASNHPTNQPNRLTGAHLFSLSFRKLS